MTDPVTQAALEALSRATIRSYSHKQRDLRLDFESNDDLTAVVVMVGHRIASQTASPDEGIGEIEQGWRDVGDTIEALQARVERLTGALVEFVAAREEWFASTTEESEQQASVRLDRAHDNADAALASQGDHP